MPEFDSNKILAEIRKLHFSSKKLANQIAQGTYRSAFKGRGIEFEEVRPYVPGDDIRSIDWKVTARSNSPHIKLYKEERELNVLILIDISQSMSTGTRGQLLNSLAGTIGAALTLIALRNNDKVGLITFSDKIHTYIPPRKTRSSTTRVLKEVISPNRDKKQNESNIWKFINNTTKKKSIVFLISDFDGSIEFNQAFQKVAKKHDVNLIAIRDPYHDLSLIHI